MSPFLGSLTAPARALVAALVALLCLAGALTAAGWSLWRAGGNTCEAATQIEQQQGQIDHLRWLGQYADFQAQLAGDYILRRGQAEQVYRTLYSEVPRVVTHYIPVPGAPIQPVPACVFTHGFVGVWNRALTADRDVPTAESGAAQAAAAQRAVEAEALHDAGIRQADVLDNHIANSQVSTAVRLQCEQLIEFHTRGPEAPR